jgi:hypothetical protein
VYSGVIGKEEIHEYSYALNEMHTAEENVKYVPMLSSVCGS